VRGGWITADERTQLEALRTMTLDAITVDDFEAWELRSAGYRSESGNENNVKDLAINNARVAA
jgi:acyl-CoA dehydrogenase